MIARRRGGPAGPRSGRRSRQGAAPPGAVAVLGSPARRPLVRPGLRGRRSRRRRGGCLRHGRAEPPGRDRPPACGRRRPGAGRSGGSGGVEASFARRAGPELLWDLIIGASSEVDRRVFTDPAFAAANRRALAERFVQGAAGYARDLVLATSRWPFDPAAVRVPVDLWYGGQDASPVHSPDRGAELARRLPTARRHLLPAAGGAVLWTHSEAILAALLAALRR
jgi:pimeloyl-ACP methyl ester carboxylesterase